MTLFFYQLLSPDVGDLEPTGSNADCHHIERITLRYGDYLLQCFHQATIDGENKPYGKKDFSIGICFGIVELSIVSFLSRLILFIFFSFYDQSSIAGVFHPTFTHR